MAIAVAGPSWLSARSREVRRERGFAGRRQKEEEEAGDVIQKLNWLVE